MKKLSVLAITLSLVAIVMSSITCFTWDKKVEKTLYNNPEMVIDAFNRFEQVAREKQMASLEAVIKEHIGDLHNNAATPFIGPETAKVNLVMFYDYSCGYCHKLYPILKELADKNQDVKFVFKPLRFLGEVSNYAAAAVMAANEEGKFKEFNDELFNFKGQLTPTKIDEIASSMGIDLAKHKDSMESGKIKSDLEAISSLGEKAGIQGVPTMIINGKLLQTFDPKEIQKAIDSAK